VEHLIVVLNTASGKHDNRDVAFPALGEIAMAVGDAMTPHLPVIIENLHKGLAKRKDAATADLATASRRKKAAQTALTCVGSLAKAMGPRLFPHMDPLVGMLCLAALHFLSS
jgi:FKBP12-rapamycin complex-associated protein